MIGTACLMIASKNEEVSYIHVESVLKNIAYEKFSKEELLEMELQILQVIGFRVNLPTIHDICRCAFRFFHFKSKKLDIFFQNSALLVAKTCLFSEELMNHFSYDEIAALSMIMVLKIVEKIDPSENIDSFAKLIVKIFKLEKKSLVKKLQFLTEYTLEFDSLFPYVKNLKKFYSFSFD